ncbi:MAG: hypothetical protein HOV80_28045 [Polyangiaceae bacterium]|nr:hypothetical protein [Polyangiaceae bacterium]
MISTLRFFAVLTVGVAALSVASGCSLIIENRDRQCENDEDCAGFGDATCEISSGICVARAGSTASGSTGSAACEGPDGCFACEPTKTEEFLNGCTDVACVPYDNGQLQGLLQEDGSVPPVP